MSKANLIIKKAAVLWQQTAKLKSRHLKPCQGVAPIRCTMWLIVSVWPVCTSRKEYHHRLFWDQTKEKNDHWSIVDFVELWARKCPSCKESTFATCNQHIIRARLLSRPLDSFSAGLAQIAAGGRLSRPISSPVFHLQSKFLGQSLGVLFGDYYFISKLKIHITQERQRVGIISEDLRKINATTKANLTSLR